MEKEQKFELKNMYGLEGGGAFSSPEAALSAAKSLEGRGWFVKDSEGEVWVWNKEETKAVIEDFIF